MKRGWCGEREGEKENTNDVFFAFFFKGFFSGGGQRRAASGGEKTTTAGARAKKKFVSNRPCVHPADMGGRGDFFFPAPEKKKKPAKAKKRGARLPSRDRAGPGPSQRAGQKKRRRSFKWREWENGHFRPVFFLAFEGEKTCLARGEFGDGEGKLGKGVDVGEREKQNCGV